jgi:hypothetical protein
MLAAGPKSSPNHARALRRKARPQNRGSRPWSLSTTKESSKLTSLTRSQLSSDTRAGAHFLSRASRLWPSVSWVILPSARCNRRQGSRIRPTTSELIQVGWSDRHSLAGRSRCPVPETAVRASIPETSQTATIARTVPETVAPKADTAFLDPEQEPQMPQSLAAPLQTATVATAPDAVAPKTDAPFLDQERVQTPRSLAAVEQPDVEILAKIPVPRPRPTATPARKSMLVPPRSARATPPSSRTPIPPH